MCCGYEPSFFRRHGAAYLGTSEIEAAASDDEYGRGLGGLVLLIFKQGVHWRSILVGLYLLTVDTSLFAMSGCTEERTV